MKPVDQTVKSLLVEIKLRLLEERQYDYEAKEICHKIDRIIAGKEPQRSPDRIKSILNEALR